MCPFYAKWFRFSMFWRSGEGVWPPFVKADPEWNDADVLDQRAERHAAHDADGEHRGNLGERPELTRRRSMPEYPPGGKRMLIDNGNWIRSAAVATTCS